MQAQSAFATTANFNSASDSNSLSLPSRLLGALALSAFAVSAAAPAIRAQDGKAIVEALGRKGILTVTEADQLAVSRRV